MKLLVVILTVFVGSCYALPGEDPCTWGPAYWCKDGASAKDCSAIEYCQLNVWKDKDVVSFTELRPATNKSPQSDLCKVCQMVAHFLKPFVDNNATEPKVQADLEEICKVMGNYSKECTQYVREYFPMMFELLKQGEDTGQLCQMLKLCNSTTAAVTQPIESPGVNLCSICKLVANFLKGFVDSNSSEEEAEKGVELLCHLLPGNYSTECTKLVDEYFPDIWILLKSEVDSGQICVFLKLCNSTSGPLPVHSPKAPQANNCQLCELVVNFIKPFVDSNTTEEEAQAGLDKMCALLPTIGAECKTLVNEYFPFIWKLLQEEVDSGKICTEIGLCPKPMARAATSKSKQASGENACQLCELVTSFLKPFLDNNATEEEALTALEKVCSLLPSTFGQECNQFVKQYFPSIWKFLEQEFDSDEFCKLIGVCPGPAAEPKDESPESSLCDDCKRVVSFLRPFVDSNSTEEEAKTAVEAFCKLIPSVGATLCDLIVDRYFDDIWKLLQNEVDTDKICQQLHLCPNTLAVTVTMEPASKAEPEPGDIECNICGSILDYVYGVLKDNATKGDIEATLNKVCDHVPASYAPLCKDLVDKFTDELIQFIEADLPPNEICKKLGFCGAASRAAKPRGDIECTICKFILKYAEEYLAKNATEADIEEFLDKVCDLFPVGKSECEALVKQYLPELINFIESEESPEVACKEIGLCSGMMAAAKMVDREAECDLCTMVLKYVDAILTKNASEAEVVALLDKVCHYFPAAIQKECVAFVDAYAKDIIPLIVQELDPEKICTMIGVCPKAWTGLRVATRRV